MKRKAAFEIIRNADSDSDTLGSMSSSNIPYDDETDSDILKDEDKVLDQLHEESDVYDIVKIIKNNLPCFQLMTKDPILHLCLCIGV